MTDMLNIFRQFKQKHKDGTLTAAEGQQLQQAITELAPKMGMDPRQISVDFIMQRISAIDESSFDPKALSDNAEFLKGLGVKL